MITKEHNAILPASSMNKYMTFVDPTGNRSPDLCVCINVGGMAELSVAVGSIHVTTVDGVPRGTVYVEDSGQDVTVGSAVSTSTTENKMNIQIRIQSFSVCYISYAFTDYTTFNTLLICNM